MTIDPPMVDEPDEEEGEDVAPVGPTEYAGSFAELSPESQGAPTVVSRPPASMEQLEQQIRDLEARLDGMMKHPPSHEGGEGAVAKAEVAPLPTRTPARPVPPPPIPSEPGLGWKAGGTIPAGAVSWSDSAVTSLPTRSDPPYPPARPEADDEARVTARELLPPDFYMRQWGRAARRRRAEEVDEFGHDPKYEERFLPLFDFLYKNYFRVETEGVHHVPTEGRCLLVANHSGGPLPYDGIMLRTTVRRELHSETPRELRWLAEDFVYYLPFVGTAMNRLGAVRACQENAERLLAAGKLVAVFPEGAKGIGKLFRERYQLQRFGRGGFIRLCLRTGTPIVPAAIVGAEEANPMLYRIEYMAKTLGIPYLPITPTFPALGPLGLLPAPTKWRVAFGEPMSFDAYGPEAADDDILVGRLAERVRATIQAMLDRMVAGRKSVWFG